MDVKMSRASQSGKYWAKIRNTKTNIFPWVVTFYSPAYEGSPPAVLFHDHNRTFEDARILALDYLYQGGH